MHFIQARVFRDIIEYIQDKTGKEPTMLSCSEGADRKIYVVLKYEIPTEYPGISVAKKGSE